MSQTPSEQSQRPDLAVLWTELRSFQKQCDLQREADAKAVALKAGDYERRLDNLNHLQTLAMDDRTRYLPRETHD